MAARRPRLGCMLDDFVSETICASLEIGATFTHAAEAAGVRATTASVWLSRGRNYDREVEAGRDPNPADEPFYKFLCAVEEARNKTRCKVSEVVMTGILGRFERDEDGNITKVLKEPNPELALKWLERQDPVEWGRTWRPEAPVAVEEERSIEERVAHGEQLIAQAAEQIARDAARRE